MKKTLVLTISEDSYEMCETSHEVIDDNHVIFSCYNLDSCPEDAIIGRCLFNGYDYIEAVEFGMKLAQEGYTGIELDIREE